MLGFVASSGDRDLLTVETTRGAAQTISTGKYGLTSRGGRGRELLQRGEFTRVLPAMPELPEQLAELSWQIADGRSQIVLCHLRSAIAICDLPLRR